MKRKHVYERQGIFVNINKDLDAPLTRALDEYVQEMGIPVSTALKALARKQLVAEGRIRVIRARN